MSDQEKTHAFDRLVDCIGQRCPLPVLKARKALGSVANGAVVKIDSSDPMAIVDIAHMAREDGHTILDRMVDGDRSTFWIRRGSA